MALLMRESHERWDGRGAEAVEELQRCSGTQFEPRVVRAFCHAHGASAVAV